MKTLYFYCLIFVLIVIYLLYGHGPFGASYHPFLFFEEQNTIEEDSQSIESTTSHLQTTDPSVKKPLQIIDSDYDQIVALNSHELPKEDFTMGNAFCQGGDAKNCVPSFKHHNHEYWPVEQAKTNFCLLPKNMATLTVAIICLLNDEENFLRTKKSLVGNFTTESCLSKRVKSLEEASQLYNTSDWNHLAIVREPFDRFISAFLFTCLKGFKLGGGVWTKYCFGCGTNMTCYMERHYENIMNLSKKDPQNLDMAEFHLIPQNWRCSFDKLLQNYTFLHYNSDSKRIVTQMVDYLRHQNVSQKALNFIENSALKERTGHSTVKLSLRPFFENRLRSSPYLMKMFYRIYYHDFRLFNYTIDF